MAKHGKKYRAALEKIEEGRKYTLDYLALKHQDHLFKTSPLRNQPLQDCRGDVVG